MLCLLEWVCWKGGVDFAKVDPKGSGQIGCKCWGMVSNSWAVGGPQCPECRYRVHRDSASALGTVLGGLEVVLRAGSA
ncbi:zinc ribbon domain-containing protein [Thermostichus sp. OS-CIW-28]